MTDRSALSHLVRILGRGPGRSRNLERHEAARAMRLMLEGDAAPEAVGALLMLMRYRGENPDEIAGFADGARAGLGAWRDVGAAVDWPSYAAGKSRGLPLFLLSARLVAQAGLPVLMHGWNSASHMRPGADLRAALPAMEVPVVQTPAGAAQALRTGGIAYAALEAMSPDLHRLLRLRDVLGLRSAVNTTLRVLNPSGAATSVQGVFHPPYRPLQVSAALLLGQPRQMALKGGGGEFERNPAKTVILEGAARGDRYEMDAPPIVEEARRLSGDEAPDPALLPALWSGARRDAFSEAVVIATAAAALLAAGEAPGLPEAEDAAARLWRDRLGARAA